MNPANDRTESMSKQETFGKSKRLTNIAITISCLFFLQLINPCQAKENAKVAQPDPDIKLVLQITIDQLRGDLPQRFKKRFGKGGFNYLFKNGAFYANAHYNHADTETAPGHATLVTGGTPARHGIIASEWWDKEKKRVVYAVEDESYPLIGDTKSKTAGTTTNVSGRAPTNLLSTTIGDEIYIASEKKAKVFAVSGKDRGAIIPGGRIGKAFWLADGKMTTSTYYYKSLPNWVTSWNKKELAESYRNKSWSLLQAPNSYWRIKDDKRPYEGSYKHLGANMPKTFKAKKDKHFYKGLMHSYVNDELVLDFAKHLIAKNQMGQNQSTDYLSVSFSAVDYVGHTWGVESLESEDTLLRVDKNLAELFSYINKNVGLNKTLIVLSADHGVAEISDYMENLGFPSAVIDSHKLVNHINSKLKEKFDCKKNLISRFLYPYIYFDTALLKERDIDLEDVQDVACKAAMNFPGITFACSSEDIREGELPSNDGIYARIRNNYNAKRSGHVHLVADQYRMLVHWAWNGKPGMHGTVWSYDSFVPIIISGPGIKNKRIARRVGPHDIAPTIAAYLGIKPPSGAIGNPLEEAIPQ